MKHTDKLRKCLFRRICTDEDGKPVVNDPGERRKCYFKHEIVDGYFHHWILEQSFGTKTCAIVELLDGTVEHVAIEDIKFIEE